MSDADIIWVGYLTFNYEMIVIEIYFLKEMNNETNNDAVCCQLSDS